MKPRKNYRTRPKKSGAKRTQRIKAQKKRLVAAGHDEKDLKKKNIVEIRELIKVTAKKQAKKAKAAKKPVKAPKASKTAKA